MPGCGCGCGHTGGAWQRPCTVPGGCGSTGCDGYGNLPDDGPPPTCLLCGRKRPVPDRVDAKCRQRVQEWIADLPSLYRRLDVELVPGQGAGEKVRSSSPGSRTAATLAALSLRGTSQRLAQPDWRRPAGWTPEEADLSIPEWVDGWVRAWRSRHAHHRPSLTVAHPTDLPDLPLAPERPDIRNERGDLLPPGVIRRRLEAWTAELAVWQAARDEAAAEGGRVVLGLGAALGPAGRPDDPQELRLTHRYGQAPAAYKLGVDCGYLAAWFERACDDEPGHPDVEAFILGLRSLVGRAKNALGERSDLVYLGRCPQPFYDRETDERRPCGAHLTVDACVDRIACRRCRGEWPKEKWLFLCAQIREVWGVEDGPSRQTWEAAS